jgi:RHS repeat-associated protein
VRSAPPQPHKGIPRLASELSAQTRAAAYSFGFQGQEKDDELHGATGTSFAFEYRMHDPRVGRFLSLDPLSAKYPHNSPYAFSENRVIDGVELEGLEVSLVNPEQDKCDGVHEDDTGLQRAAANQKDQTAEHIYSHGNWQQLLDCSSGHLGAVGINTDLGFLNLLGERIDKWNNRETEKPFVVVLHACNVGHQVVCNGETWQRLPFAQQMSKSIPGLITVAPDDFYWTVPSGEVIGVEGSTGWTCWGGYARDRDTGAEKPRNRNGIAGSWRVFRSGVEVLSYGGKEYPDGPTGDQVLRDLEAFDELTSPQNITLERDN